MGTTFNPNTGKGYLVILRSHLILIYTGFETGYIQIIFSMARTGLQRNKKLGCKIVNIFLSISLNISAVILLPAHPASFAHNFVSGMQLLFQRVPGCNSIAELSLKKVFWTHKFTVGHIDMGNSESKDP